jgi:hypothetical protein
VVAGRFETPLVVAVCAAVVVGLLLLVPVARAGARLRATGGPGIVPFQLAETDREARRILRAWGPDGRAAARRSLGWQFGLIVCYVVAIGGAALCVATRADNIHVDWLAVAETAAAVLTLLAGAANCVGNGVLLTQLRTERVVTRRLAVSRTCARFTFVATGLSGLAVLGGFGLVQLAG